MACGIRTNDRSRVTHKDHFCTDCRYFTAEGIFDEKTLCYHCLGAVGRGVKPICNFRRKKP